MRSHPEQTTSPPLMVRAPRAPARAAEGQAGALQTQPTPAGRAARGTSRSGFAPQSDGVGGVGWLRGAAPRPSLFSAGRRTGTEAGCAPEADTSGPGPPPVQGTSASLQCVRLAARRPVPPALSSDRAPRDSAPAPSRGLGPPALRPLRSTSPERFPKRTLRCTRAHRHTHALTHTLSHAHNAQRGAHSGSPALGFGCAPGDPILPPPRERVGHFPAHPGSREERGSREGPVDSGHRAGPGSAAKRGASPGGGRWAGSGSRRRVGSRSRPRRRAGSGGGTRRSAARLRGRVPLSRALALLPRRLPHPGRAAGSEPPGPRPDPSLSRPLGSLFLPFLLPFPRSGRLRCQPRLSLKLRPSAPSQNNKGWGGGAWRRRERAREGAGALAAPWDL